MYNLLVSGIDSDWEGAPRILELERCVREYTDIALTEKYGSLSPHAVNELRRLPCMFAYESSCKKDPKFGVIQNVRVVDQQAKIDYEIIPLEKFLSFSDLIGDLAFDLDISKWEMNRTHWAVKDINLAKELHARGVTLPNWARTATKAVDVSQHVFQVALSFPGQVRSYVEQVAEALEHEIGPNSYFYDNNYVSQLAQPSLDVLLQGIYGKRARLVVVFLGGDYQGKEWCGVEFRAIKEIIMSREPKRIMFVRMDDGEVDGVFKTDGFVDGRKHSPKDIARFIQERVAILAEGEGAI